MLISIITPAFNSEKYIEECIQSIKKQKVQNYEHIIIDGGSTDGTLDIIRAYEGTYPMRWISEKDSGMYEAIAKGFSMAKGDVFCWLNTDDVYMPWTTDIVAHVFKHPNINWCTGIPAQTDEKGLVYFPSTHFVTFPRYCIRKGWMDGRRLGCVQQESCFWRRSLYESVGGVDWEYKLAGDYALWVKFAQKEKLYSVNTVLAAFRVHEGQKSGDKMAYCNEAHKISIIECIIYRLKIYKIINYILKKNNKILDVRLLLERCHSLGGNI